MKSPQSCGINKKARTALGHNSFPRQSLPVPDPLACGQPSPSPFPPPVTHGSAPFPPPHSSPFSSFSSSFKNHQQLRAWQHHRSPARGGDISKAAAAEVGKFEKSLKTLQDSPPPPAPEAPTAQTGARVPRASGPRSCWSSSRSSPGKEKKKSFPKRKVACCSTVSLPPSAFPPPQDPKIPPRNSQGATWSGAPPPPGEGSAPLPCRPEDRSREAEGPGGTGAARLGRQARPRGSPLSCSSACKQMGMFFFQPGMVSAP